MNKKTKTMVSFLLRIIFSVGLLVFVFSKIDLQQTGEVLKSADVFYLFLAAGAFLVVNAILLVRWTILIKALDLSASLMSVVKHFFYGLFGNLFLPTAIGGDILKAVGLCKKSTQKPRVIASILLDRLSGFASIVIIAVTAFVLGYASIDDKSLVIPIVVMGAGALSVAAILFNEQIYSFFCKIFNRLPRFKQSLMNMHYDIALLKEGHKYKAGIKVVILSCCSQIIFCYSYYLTAKALHQDVSFVYFLIFIPIICVISAFPSIGGLGVREVGAAYLFTKVGVDSGIAVSMTLINFLFMVVIGLVGGVIYVYSLSAGRVQHNLHDAGVEPVEP